MSTQHRRRFAFRIATVFVLGSFVHDAHAGPNALVYAENAVRTPVPSRMPLVDRPGSSRFDVVSCVDRSESRNVPLASGETSLHVCSLEAFMTPDREGDFVAEPGASVPKRASGDAFAEASVHFHLGRTLDLFERLLSSPDVLPNRPSIVVGARWPSPSSDTLPPIPLGRYLSMFDPATSAVRDAFGVRGSLLLLGDTVTTSMAQDGDVVIHEGVHAVLDTGSPPVDWVFTRFEARREPAALREALADYFAAVLTNDPVIGDQAFADGTLGPPRNLSTVVTTDEGGVDGDEYAESLAYSGALWRSRGLLGDDGARLDAAVARVARAGKYTSSAAEFVGALAIELDEQGSSRVGSVVLHEFARAHVGSDGPRLFDSTRGTATARNGFVLSPGKRTTGTASPVPGTAQIRVEVPEGASRMRIVLTGVGRRTTWGAVPGSDPRLVALVSWDRPVEWTEGSPTAEAIPLKDGNCVAPVRSNAKYSYIQISNVGDEDGLYRRVTVTFDVGSEVDVPVPRSASHGCTVSVESDSSDARWSVALVSLTEVLRRRRKARRRIVDAERVGPQSQDDSPTATS